MLMRLKTISQKVYMLLTRWPSIWFNNMKLKYKLLFFYLFIIFIPIASFGALFTSRIADTIMKQTIDETTASVNTINENLRNNIRLIEDISDYIYINSAVNMDLIKKYDNPADSIAAYIDVFYPAIRDTRSIHSDFVREISVYTPNNTTISNGSEIIYASHDIVNQKWYQDALNSNGNKLWGNSLLLNNDLAQNKAYDISLYRALNNFTKSDSAGVLKIDVDEAYFYNLIKGNDASKLIYIINPGGSVISCTDRNEIGQSVTEMGWLKTALEGDKGWYNIEKDGQQWFVVYNTCNTDIEGRDGWKTVSVTLVNSLYQSVYKARTFGILVCLICMFVLTVLIILFSEGITKRIKKLADKTRRVSKGDFNEMVDVSGCDEVAELGTSINEMAMNLKQLIKEVYESRIHMQEYEIKKKEAELNVLQSQINPHFLYNTLDAIRMHAIIGDQHELADMLVSLSSLLRYSINRGKEIVAIEDEIKYVENYVSILNMRYDDSITLNLGIPKEMLGYRILKLVIQPLVENAFVHGLKMIKGPKTINVTGNLGNDTIQIDVEDNGVGMNETELVSINRDLEQVSRKEESNTSIGLNNVNSRIKLYFGAQYGIRLYSIQGKGTKVSLTLPVKEME